MTSAVQAFLAGLEHEHDVAVQRIAVRAQQPSRAGQHRGVQIVAAGVHHAVDRAAVLDVSEFLHRQGVHVAAQQDGRHRAARLGGTAQDRGH